MMPEGRLARKILSSVQSPTRPTLIERNNRGFAIFPQHEREKTSYVVSEVAIGTMHDIAIATFTYAGETQVLDGLKILDYERFAEFLMGEPITEREQKLLEKLASGEDPVRVLPVEEGDFIILHRGGTIDRILLYATSGKILDVATTIITKEGKLHRAVIKDWELLRKLIGLFIPQEDNPESF